MAQVNIRMDDELKRSGDELFNELGISMSAAVNMFVAQAVRDGGIPFSITTRSDPFYSDSNIKALQKSIKEADNGRVTPHDLLEF